MCSVVRLKNSTPQEAKPQADAIPVFTKSQGGLDALGAAYGLADYSPETSSASLTLTFKDGILIDMSLSQSQQ